MSRAIPEPEQLFEIQSTNLATEAELTSLYSSCWHAIRIVLVFENRWNCLNTIPKSCDLLEAFSIFRLDVFSSHHALSGDCLFGDPLEYLRLALILEWAVHTVLSVKRYETLFCGLFVTA